MDNELLGNFEKLGSLIDELDSLAHALSLGLPPEMHLDQLKKLLPEKVVALKEVYTEIAGENPWD